MPRGVTFSSVLHLVVLLLVYFGMPSLFKVEDPIERPIPVTVYPMRDETVLPPPQAPEREAVVAPEAEPEPTKEPVPMPPDPDVAHEAPPPPPDTTPAKPEPAPRVAEAVAPPPPPTIPEPSAAPPPPPPKPAQVATLKPRPKPEPEPLIEEKPEPPNLLESLLKSVIESTQHEIKLEQKQAKAAPVETPPEVVSTSRVTDEPLSSSVSDAIRRQVEDKWNVPAGAANAGDLAVEIRILLMPDGEVRRAEIVDQARLSDAFYRTMAESARRAVLQASPLRDLPPDRYEDWREITFRFRPPV